MRFQSLKQDYALFQKKEYGKLSKLLLFIFILFSLNGLAQETIYYNKYWKPCSKKNASFMRTIKPVFQQFEVIDYYYPSLKIQMTGTYNELLGNKEIENGSFRYFSESGFMTSEGVFINGKKEGVWKYYFDKETLWYTKSFRNDREEGDCFTYYPNGTKKRKEVFKSGYLLEGFCYTPEGKDTSYFPKEQLPEFEGGEDSLYSFLAKNLIYPPLARQNNFHGEVIAQFTVDPNGKIKDVVIQSSPHYTLSTETLRILFLMPPWKPGRQEGYAVPVKFTLPVKFQLNE